MAVQATGPDGIEFHIVSVMTLPARATTTESKRAQPPGSPVVTSTNTCGGDDSATRTASASIGAGSRWRPASSGGGVAEGSRTVGVAVGTGCGGCGGDDVEVSGGSVGDPLGTEVAAGGRGAVVVPTGGEVVGVGAAIEVASGVRVAVTVAVDDAVGVGVPRDSSSQAGSSRRAAVRTSVMRMHMYI